MPVNQDNETYMCVYQYTYRIYYTHTLNIHTHLCTCVYIYKQYVCVYIYVYLKNIQSHLREDSLLNKCGTGTISVHTYTHMQKNLKVFTP